MATETFVIVGASLTAATAAGELREQGFDGRIVLVGDDPELPYERPPLSKQLLRGESSAEEAHVHPASFYDEHSIELRRGIRAERIDRDAGEVVVTGGERLGFDRLVLATGARPHRLPVPGADLEGVLTLRTLADSRVLHERFSSGGRLAVVGGGWIGCEVAASARQMGMDVTIIEAGAVPLERVVGARLGEVFAGLHRDNGVDVLTGAGVEGFDGSGAVEAVRLAGGARVECDVAVVGVGVAPNAELAAEAGLAVGDGIEVDERLRTADERIFAAGDVASVQHPRYGRRVRVEHWENARVQGAFVARSMLGAGESFDWIPYFFSDQYDLGLEYSGLAGRGDELVVRGDLAAREFIAFWVRDGHVTAGMNVNVWDVTDKIRDLIASGEPLESADLTV